MVAMRRHIVSQVNALYTFYSVDRSMRYPNSYSASSSFSTPLPCGSTITLEKRIRKGTLEMLNITHKPKVLLLLC